MSLTFNEAGEKEITGKIKVRTWLAQPTDTDTMQIICMSLQDLMNVRQRRRNFIGYEKPKLGTLEELTSVYMCNWLRKQGDNIRTRPLVGGFNGGFASYREAVQMCNDVWAARHRYSNAIIRPQ